MKFLPLILFLYSSVFAVNHDWKTITTMNEVGALSADSTHLWVATSGGIYSYGLDENSLKQYTNIDGMNSVDTRAIIVDDHNMVITGNAEGIIEVFDKGSSGFSQLFSLQGNEIKQLLYRSDTLWAAAGKGLAAFVWDGRQYAFVDFFQNFNILPTAVYSVAYFKDRIWLGTDQGLLSAPADLSRYTINDPANWTVYDFSDGLPDNTIQALHVFDEKLWIGTSAGLSSIDNTFNLALISNWVKNSGDDNYRPVTAITSDGINLKLASSSYYYSRANAGSFSTLGKLGKNVTAMTSDQSGRLWIGSAGDGIMTPAWEKTFKIDGPVSNAFLSVIKDYKGDIWALSGKPKSYRSLGFYTYNGTQWQNFDFSGSGWSALHNNVLAYEDRFNNMWLGTWGGGLMVFPENGQLSFFHNYGGSGNIVVKTIDTTEVISLDDYPVYSDFFTGVAIAPEYEVVSAVKEDRSGRLWIANYWSANNNFLAVAPYTDNGFLSLDKDDWVYFGTNDGINPEEGGITCIAFDEFRDRAYFGTVADGVYALDFNGTLSNKNDDQLGRLELNDNLYSNTIQSLAFDQDGILWIGTAAGLNSFDGINVYKHVGDPNGESGPLENQINFITVDRYNNKWFGTSGGLSILRSERSAWDAKGWIGFSTENSGLVNNEVHGIYVDSDLSEALIATEHGLSVYRGSFAQIQENYEGALGGPNPFILDGSSTKYRLSNLMSNSSVKIFTVNGVLVRELSPQRSLTDGTPEVDGSRAFWDGRDLMGNTVASGIYLYLAYAGDGNSTAGKIAVIRK